MKQTAVEWLLEQIEKRYGLTPTSILLFRDAKEMEEQQIIEAFFRGACDGDFHTINALEYYNEKFKNK